MTLVIMPSAKMAKAKVCEYSVFISGFLKHNGFIYLKTILQEMHLFTEVRSLYGQTTVIHIRDLECTKRKLVRHRQHLTFTHRCNGNGVTPPSLKIRCPITRKKRETSSSLSRKRSNR